MAKYRIKSKTVAHGTISWRHEGKDSQYCEAGDLVTLDWQPTAGWGLQEAHYTDTDGNVTPITGGAFTMPAKDITIGGTFKRFALDDWAGDKDVTNGPLESIGSFGKDDLPKLEGDDAVGTLAFVMDTKKYATWNGNYWTYFDGKPVVPQWLRFTSRDGEGMGFIVLNDGYELPEDYKAPNIEYSLDGGKTWEAYDLQISGDASEATLITLDAGESILFRGVNDNLSYYLEGDDDYLRVQCYMEGFFSAEGDVTSLLNGIGGDVPLADYCYSGMFYGCTGLTTAPALPATTLASNCYGSMFSGCTSLTEAPALPATALADYCYSGMFYGCTGLTTAPALPATTLVEGCYAYMFNGCTGITSHHVATLNDSVDVFDGNSSCDTFTIDADTPPTIGSNTITGLKADCAIYVPADSVDAYKAKQYWSARSAYIQAKP